MTPLPPGRQAILQAAGQALAAGDAVRSAGLLERLLAGSPADADAIGMLAAAAERTGDFAALRRALARGLKAAPGHPLLLFLRGVLAGRDGHAAAGEADLRRAVAAAPQFLEARLALGAALGQAGRHDEALPVFAAAAAAFPASVPAQANAAIAALKLGRLNEAERGFRAAAGLAPRQPDLHLNLALVLLRLERPAEALAAAETALALQPTGLAHQAAGDALLALGRASEAHRRFSEAAQAMPGDPGPVVGIAGALIGMGRPDLARRMVEPVVAQYPGHQAARLTLAQACVDGGSPDQAIGHWQAVVAETERADLLALIGGAQILIGQTEDGLATLNRVSEASPDPRIAIQLATALPAIPASRQEIDGARQRFLDETTALAGTVAPLGGPPAVGCGTFLLAYHALDSRDHRAAYARLMRAAMPQLGLVAPHCREWRRPAQARPRVGFVSSHLFDHTIADLFGGLAAGLDRGRFDPWLFLPPGPEDAVRQRLRAGAAHAVDLPADVFAAQRAMAEAGLDALIFLDIGMQPGWDLLAYARLAPVQAVLWGHPETTGIDTVDYFLSSAAMEPADGAAHYHERLVGLPGSGAATTRPPSGPPLERASLGLPEGGRLYVCPQTLVKLHPDFDGALAEILRADATARVVLLQAPFAAMAERVRARFCRTAEDVADRLVFLPPVAKPDFPRLLAACDVMLDPFHYSGGHTTLTAFSVGLPVITWPGDYMRGRHTYGFYRLMGLADCIADDHRDYVRRALAIGGDTAERRRISAAIGETRGVLFDPAAAIRAIEDFLDDALARAAC